MFYTKLQNMRYNGQINFLIDISEDLFDYQIPKMTFQPIVENVIQHGILEKESRCGSIVLTGWIEENIIYFQVSDDGIGMDATTLSNILSGNHRKKRGSNIGVYNTHQRLLLLYGPDYGLSYASVLGEGTTVTIKIPMIVC